MKEYIVKVSEEITTSYRIKAENKEQAEEFALDNCNEGIESNIDSPERDRVEVIDTKLVKEVVTKKFLVNYTKSVNLQIEIEADNKEEAKELADKYIDSKAPDQLLDEAQIGYWEHTDTEDGEL